MGKTNQANIIIELRKLADDPDQQAEFALSLIQPKQDKQTLEAALRVLQENPLVEARPVLVALYNHFAHGAQKKDIAAYIRAATLRALKPVATLAEIALLEEAVWTYEQTPSMHDAQCAQLRAAALQAINEVSETLASYHAARLLSDTVISEMSGEPAITAVRVLAEQGNTLPIYQYVAQDGAKHAEVVGECLRWLSGMPETLLPQLVDKYINNPSEVLLMGLFDLIINHKAGDKFNSAVLDFLKKTELLDLYRYVILACITRQRKELLAEIANWEKTEKNSAKKAILAEVLPHWKKGINR